MRPRRPSSLIATTTTLGLLLSGSAVMAQDDPGTAGEEVSTASPAEVLTSVVWNVETVGPAPPLKEQTARFEPGGGLRITTGCAAYAGAWSVEGESLTIEPMQREFGSIEDCSFGEMGSADNYRNTFEDAETWATDEEGRLVIESDVGRITFAPGAPATEETDGAPSIDANALAGTWQLLAIRPVPGEEAVVPEDIDMTLVLGVDGAVSGMGGCSAFSGSFTLAGEDGIRFDDVVAEEGAACEGAPADYQQLYLSLMSVVDAAELDVDELTLEASMLGAELAFTTTPQ